jgi:hypothetical protein
LLDIDAGSTPAGYYILADSSLQMGDLAAARRYLRLSREASLFWPRSLSPGMFAAVRRHLTEGASSCGFAIVDLPRLLEASCGGAIPDRRLFHDYCHMTEYGTWLCTAHIAECLTPLLGGPTFPADWFAASTSSVAPEVQAGANFLAAILNADMGQSRSVVRHHLSQAVESCPAVVQLMTSFLDFRIRRTPSILCDSLEQFLGILRLSGLHLAYGLGRRENEKTLNVLLIEECSRVASALDHGVAARVESLLFAEHGVSRREIDLLHASSAPIPYERQMYRGAFGYYRAFDPTSSFVLICDAPARVRLWITYRAGESADPRTLRIGVNGSEVATLAVSSRWRTESILIPAEALRIGANEVAIRWPPAMWDHDRWVDATADLFENNFAPEISPVYGHISAFRAHTDTVPPATVLPN